MPTRVTPYLGGTGQDNRGKINVHPSLNRVSIGADVFASANLQIHGNSFANTAEGRTTNFQALNVFSSTSSAQGNIFSYSSNNVTRLDLGVATNTFSILTVATGSSPHTQFTTNSNISNVYFDFDIFNFRSRGGAQRGIWNNTGFAVGTSTISNNNVFAVLGNTYLDSNVVITGNASVRTGMVVGPSFFSPANIMSISGNVFIDGNVYVTGTTTLVNSAVVAETGNAYTANAYVLTKFSSNILPSNGFTFLNSNVAIYAYGRTPIELDTTGGILLPSNSYIAANGSIGIGTRDIPASNLTILSATGSMARLRRAGNNGDYLIELAGIGNGDGITYVMYRGAGSATQGYQFLSFDGTRNIQALTINRFGNVSIGNQSLNMANLSVQGNAYVATTAKAANIIAGTTGVTALGSLYVAGNGGVVISSVGDASAYDSLRGWFFPGSSNPTFTWDTMSAPGSGTVETWMRWRNNNNGGNNNFGLLVDGRVKVGYNGSLPAANLEVMGNAYVSTDLRIGNRVQLANVVGLTDSIFGYSTTYKVLQVGNADAAAISLGVNANAIAGATFSGPGQILTPNGKSFLVPNAAGTDWMPYLRPYLGNVYIGTSGFSGEVNTAQNGSVRFDSGGQAFGYNLIASNAILGATGSWTGAISATGITSISYVTVGSTGFFSADTSGQFLFRHSAQVKGAVMDVATSNGGNAFTFLTMGLAYANTYANMVTATSNLVVTNNATIGNNFVAESALGVGTKSPTSNLHVVGSAVFFNRAGQDGNEVTMWRTSSGSIGLQLGVYPSRADFTSTAGYDQYYISGKNINLSWLGSNGINFVSGTTNKHFMNNTGLAIGATSAQAANLYVTGNAYITTNVDIVGNLTAQSKSFLIKHPTKDGMQLQYASLEGPEQGVYVRGVANSNVIVLPDYWYGLVRDNTVTAQLTSVGSFQPLYIASANVYEVHVGGWSGMEFHYSVYGERADIEKLKVEF